MQQLVILSRWVTLGFLVSFTVAVFLKLLLGEIPLSGLLAGDRRGGTDYFSFGRAQLLVCTVIVAVNYLRQMTASPFITSLPDLPASTLELLGGSQLFYLVGKARALWFDSSGSPRGER